MVSLKAYGVAFKKDGNKKTAVEIFWRLPLLSCEIRGSITSDFLGLPWNKYLGLLSDYYKTLCVCEISRLEKIDEDVKYFCTI